MATHVEPVAATATELGTGSFWWSLVKSPSGAIGLVIVLVLIITALGAPWIAHHDPYRMAVGPRLAPPSWATGSAPTISAATSSPASSTGRG